MGKVKSLLLNVRYMKYYAKRAARIVTNEIKEFGMIDEQVMQDAVMARYQLDQIILNQTDLEIKWSQPMIHSFKMGGITFKGTEQECIEWLQNNDDGNCEIYYALPDDVHFSWSRYFDKLQERCGIEIV